MNILRTVTPQIQAPRPNSGKTEQVAQIRRETLSSLQTAPASFSGPADGMLDLSPAAQAEITKNLPSQQLSDIELVSRAAESRDTARMHLDSLGDSIAELNPEEQKEIGKRMFYEAASASGSFDTVEEGNRRNMTAAEIREEVSYLSNEERAEVEEVVGDWVQENPMEAENAYANGASDWAHETYHDSLPLDQQRRLLLIAQDANAIRENNIRAINDSHELFTRDSGAGQELFAALNI